MIRVFFQKWNMKLAIHVGSIYPHDIVPLEFKRFIFHFTKGELDINPLTAMLDYNQFWLVLSTNYIAVSVSGKEMSV